MSLGFPGWSVELGLGSLTLGPMGPLGLPLALLQRVATFHQVHLITRDVISHQP